MTHHDVMESVHKLEAMTIDVVEHTWTARHAQPRTSSNAATMMVAGSNDDIIGTCFDPASGELVPNGSARQLPVIVQTRSLVQGWVFYELFPENARSRMGEECSRVDSVRKPVASSLSQWCGWWVQAPLEESIMSRLCGQRCWSCSLCRRLIWRLVAKISVLTGQVAEPISLHRA